MYDNNNVIVILECWDANLKKSNAFTCNYGIVITECYNTESNILFKFQN